MKEQKCSQEFRGQELWRSSTDMSTSESFGISSLKTAPRPRCSLQKREKSSVYFPSASGSFRATTGSPSWRVVMERPSADGRWNPSLPEPLLRRKRNSRQVDLCGTFGRPAVGPDGGTNHSVDGAKYQHRSQSGRRIYSTLTFFICTTTEETPPW
jgi:hypothetical protein